MALVTFWFLFENWNSVVISRHQIYCSQNHNLLSVVRLKLIKIYFIGFIFIPKQVFSIFHKSGLQGQERVKALIAAALRVQGTARADLLLSHLQGSWVYLHFKHEKIEVPSK